MTTITKLPAVVPADWVVGPPQGQWTYADYAAIPDDGQRYEVVNGVLYRIPAPDTRHQSVSDEITEYLRQHVQMTGLGRVFSAPTDVELGPGDVVLPDVFVLLNEGSGQIERTRSMGASDLVVEILSPGTMLHALKAKLEAYERAQVQEYWIVHPGERVVELLAFEDGAYSSLGIFQGEALLPSRVVPDWSVTVEQFFASI